MNTKVNKLLKLAAVGLFLMALAINVKVTLDDPFVMLSEQAIATGSGTDSATECTCGTSWWDSKVYDCIPESCSVTVGLPPFTVTYNGTYENCQEGDTAAHCWSCADCDAGPFN